MKAWNKDKSTEKYKDFRTIEKGEKNLYNKMSDWKFYQIRKDK